MKEKKGREGFKWSFSRISLFLSCKKAYWLRYVKGYKLLLPSIRLEWGNLVHEALALYYSGKIEDPTAYIVEQGNKRTDFFEKKDRKKWTKLLEKSDALMKEYFEVTPIQFFSVGKIEDSVAAPLINLVNGEYSQEDLIWGKIDIAEFPFNKPVIVTDFKTKQREEAEDLVKKDPQLLFYAYLMFNLGHKPPIIRHINFISTSQPKIQIIESQTTERQIFDFSVSLWRIIEEIKNEKNFIGFPSFKCTFCNFFDLCIKDQYDRYIGPGLPERTLKKEEKGEEDDGTS